MFGCLIDSTIEWGRRDENGINCVLFPYIPKLKDISSCLTLHFFGNSLFIEFFLYMTYKSIKVEHILLINRIADSQSYENVYLSVKFPTALLCNLKIIKITISFWFYI